MGIGDGNEISIRLCMPGSSLNLCLIRLFSSSSLSISSASEVKNSGVDLLIPESIISQVSISLSHFTCSSSSVLEFSMKFSVAFILLDVISIDPIGIFEFASVDR